MKIDFFTIVVSMLGGIFIWEIVGRIRRAKARKQESESPVA
jgi:hypothetical protein